MPEPPVAIPLGEAVWQVAPHDALKSRFGAQTVEDQSAQEPFEAVFVFLLRQTPPGIERCDLSIELGFLLGQYFDPGVGMAALGHGGMVSVTSIEEWLARAAELDAIIGFRFHGNMVALLQGKPCYYYVYDSRIREFCELYALPYQDVRDPWVSPAEAILSHSWDKTNTALRRCHAEMQAFFKENGYQIRTAVEA